MKKAKSIAKIAGILACVFVTIIICSSFKAIKRKECNPLILMEEAMKRLKKFSMVKDYPFNFKEKKKNGQVQFLKQTITLNRGVRYKFLAVENTEFEGKPIVSIYTSEKQDILIASSYDTYTKKFYNEIEFECKTTGNYCLSFSFKDGLEGCAVGVHAFLK